MQKRSYSTRTRGTIPTTPTVNALIMHRRLQLKDRVRTGLADLISGFSLENYIFTRCSTKEWAVCARMGTSPVCNHKQHASEDLTTWSQWAGKCHEARAKSDTHPPESITWSCISNPSPSHQFNSLWCLPTKRLHQFLNCSNLFNFHFWCWQYGGNSHLVNITYQPV